ncbi:MAG: alpha/beta hydrolase, partial [Pseudomonadota bacterium]
LWLPEGTAPADGHPVILFIHGGAWLSDWSKDYAESFCEQLTARGFAVWDLEYRRLGNRDGGYPGTFIDVGLGADHLRQLAERYPLDLDRVVAVGHSAGAHLALWLAGRHRIADGSVLHTAEPLPLAGVVSLAGVNSLEESLTEGGRTDILRLVDAESAKAAGPRFEETDPGRLLPLGVPQALIVGSMDNDWRIAMSRNYRDAAREAGDRVVLDIPEGANHFDVVDPEGPFPDRVTEAVRMMLQHAEINQK